MSSVLRIAAYFLIIVSLTGGLRVDAQLLSPSPGEENLPLGANYTDYYQAPVESVPPLEMAAPSQAPQLESGHSYQFGPVRVESQTAGFGTEVPLTDAPLPPPKIIDESWHGLVFKNTNTEVSWLIGNGDSLGITTLRASQTMTFAKLPLLSLTPEFSTHFFNGPSRTDLPGQVFSSTLKISWFQPVSEQWKFLFSITPGYYTDLESNQDALRIGGMGLGFYSLSDEWTLAVGVVYLARDDVRLLPAVGLTYQPDADHKLELTFPKPKYSWRTGDVEDGARWGYVAAELGGGTWAIKRADGTDDLLTLRDFRILLGWETRAERATLDFFEVGYVFSRKVEYSSERGNYAPDSAFLIRSGWSF